ncbi:hypothetical protein KFE25_005394 [Diacronema lutheri]|uniref:protein disulfide-isomerase n=1 Tax=Diacronema lutheri TaxID=2081491 RepID=A0A8J5XM45_DIALT|nr:hypothetical protein KFE25_005394 [Diacronema lutheri]
MPDMRTALWLASVGAASALYSARDGVVLVDGASFQKEVLDFDGVVAVEFYAPWCGHCKSLVPDWARAAKALKGVVKVAAVDATAEEALARKYGIKGFPTIKLFGADKRRPSDYGGARDAPSIVQSCLNAARELVGSRIGGQGGGGGGGGGGAGTGDGRTARGEFGGSAVAQLDASSFKRVVLESAVPFLVSFYAPWCGHCKRLEPEWKGAAEALGASFGIGAVDATAEQALAQQYGVQGYPTIKLFWRGEATDYHGEREADGIVDFAYAKLEELGLGGADVAQLTAPEVWASACASKRNRLCVLAFLPHILDSAAAGRTAYLETLGAAARKSRRSPVTFLWAEAGSQPELERALGGPGLFPTLVAVSADKGRYAQMRDAFDERHIGAFLMGVLTGRTATSDLGSLGALATVEPWDGQDGTPLDEEPLDAYDDVELDG